MNSEPLPPIHGNQRRRASLRVRILGIAIPAASLSWALAIGAHAAIITLAVLLVRTHSNNPRWGGGGGGGVGGIVSSNTSPSQPTLPLSAALLPPFSVTSVTAPSADVDDSAPQWTTHHTSTGLSLSSEIAPDDSLVGLPADRSSPSPTPRSHLPPAKSLAPGADSIGGGKSSEESSGPGLPGALIGSGLPSPDYPLEARRRHQQGPVRVAIEVRPNGSMGSIHLISDSGHPLLGKSALAAAERLRPLTFTPARDAGIPVPSELVVTYNFIIQ